MARFVITVLPIHEGVNVTKNDTLCHNGSPDSRGGECHKKWYALSWHALSIKHVIFVTLPTNNILYCSSWAGKCHKKWHALSKCVIFCDVAPLNNIVYCSLWWGQCHKKWHALSKCERGNFTKNDTLCQNGSPYSRWGWMSQKMTKTHL